MKFNNFSTLYIISYGLLKYFYWPYEYFCYLCLKSAGLFLLWRSISLSWVSEIATLSQFHQKFQHIHLIFKRIANFFIFLIFEHFTYAYAHVQWNLIISNPISPTLDVPNITHSRILVFPFLCIRTFSWIAVLSTDCIAFVLSLFHCF